MRKIFQYAILSLCCLSAEINIAKSELLLQVQDLAITTAQTNKETAPVDPKNPLLTPELSTEEYDRLAFELCREHGAEQKPVSEGVFYTLRDTNIIKITSDFFKPFSHSTFTQAATVKQLAQAHPTKQAAIQSLKTNATIVEKINKQTTRQELQETLENIQHHEKAVLDIFLPKADEQIAAEKAINARLYPFWNFTKNQATVELYNRSWQAMGTGIFATAQIVSSLINYTSKLEKDVMEEAKDLRSNLTNLKIMTPDQLEALSKLTFPRFDFPESLEEIENAKTFLKQASLILDQEELTATYSTRKLTESLELYKKMLLTRDSLEKKFDDYADQNGYTLKSDPKKFPPFITERSKWKQNEKGKWIRVNNDDISRLRYYKSERKEKKISSEYHEENGFNDTYEYTLPAKKAGGWLTFKIIRTALFNFGKIAATTGIKNLPAFYKNSLHNFASLLDSKTYTAVYDLYKTWAITPEIKDVGLNWGSMAWTSFSAYFAYRIYSTNKKLFDTVQTKQIQLIHVNRYLNILQTAGKILQQDPELAQAFAQELEQINELFNASSTSIPKELRSLIQNIMSNSFSGAPSYLFSRIGKIVTTCDALEAHKHLLVPYFEILGKIDAHFAAASLYNAHKNSNNTVSICLPQVQDQEAPYISAVACWHPMIKPNIVVPNNVFMGTNGYAQNLIITGANAGGKTTTITAVTINIYLSQCFGIACADSFTITPFSHVISALDITTDLSKDQSLFKAEAVRAGMIKKHALESNKDCLVFSAIDEPFNGTRPDIASEIGYKYLDSLGNCQYHMAIVTTHFPELTTLEAKTGRFTNMKVDDATVHADTTITYPFTISRGISTQNIAQAILVTENVL